VRGGGKVAKCHPGSVADLLDMWLDDITPTRSAYTIREHRRTIREHRRTIERDIKPVRGSVRLDELTSTVTAPAAEDVQRLIGAAAESDPVLAAAIVLGAKGNSIPEFLDKG